MVDVDHTAYIKAIYDLVAMYDSLKSNIGGRSLAYQSFGEGSPADVPPRDQCLRELRILQEPAPDEPAVITRMRQSAACEWSDPSTNDEKFDRAASAAPLQATGHLGAIPLVVITAGIDEWDDVILTTIARAFEADWRQAQQELAARSTSSRHMIATESTHSIQECQPELVVGVIREQVESGRC